MFVSAQHKLVVLDAQHMPKVQRAIPHARPFRHGTTDYVVTPHKIDETVVLRNLGFNIPSPVVTQYDWPKPPNVAKEKPHQVETAAFATLNRRCFILNEIGTGKTLSAYWAAHYLQRHAGMRRVLVISPKTSLKLTHGDTLFRTFMDRTFCLLVGSAERKKRLVQNDFDFYIVNPESVIVVADELVARGDIDLILIDECAKYRNSQTEKWKVLNRIIKSKPHVRVWGMTGRPIPQEPTDAYGQVRLINPAMLSMYGHASFRSFKEATMRKVSMFKWVPKDDALETVAKVMQPSIRFSRDVTGLDMPVYQDRECELTPAQKKAFNDLLKHYITEVGGGKITAMNEAVKIMRLIQTVSGTVYDVDGEYRNLDCGPRVEVVREILEDAGQKTIIFVPFTGNLFFLKKLLEKDCTIEQIYGQTPNAERDRILYDFQNAKDPQVIVAHPACMSHSLTLTAASTIIWWAPIDSNETYTQANGRIDREGQKHAMNIFHISATSIERKAFARLKNRQKLEGSLLEIIEEMRER
jgi:SNF2 family DNA or RNA helicase